MNSIWPKIVNSSNIRFQSSILKFSPSISFFKNSKFQISTDESKYKGKMYRHDLYNLIDVINKEFISNSRTGRTRNVLETPIYDTKARLDKSNNSNYFQTTVTVSNKRGETVTIIGEECKRVKWAEASAAMKSLVEIRNKYEFLLGTTKVSESTRIKPNTYYSKQENPDLIMFNLKARKKTALDLNKFQKDKNERLRNTTIRMLTRKNNNDVNKNIFAHLPECKPPLEDMNILCSNDPTEIDTWIEDNLFENGKVVDSVGFDLEYSPLLIRGFSARTDLIQLSTDNSILLCHVTKMKTLPRALNSILETPDCRKIGVGVKPDLSRIGHDFEECEPRGALELSKLESDTTPASLSGMVGKYLKKNLVKIPSIYLSRWDLYPLSNKQINYAATDAWAAKAILNELIKKYPEEKGKLFDHN